MRSTRPPRTVMFTLTAVAAAAATVGFTIAPLYRLRTVGMDPLQLVLVGSVMEATVFLAEIPTGIVADAVSRRLSIIVGHAGMGLAFVVEASWPTFTGVLVAQALWGLSYTFTSGATTAWLAGRARRSRRAGPLQPVPAPEPGGLHRRPGVGPGGVAPGRAVAAHPAHRRRRAGARPGRVAGAGHGRGPVPPDAEGAALDLGAHGAHRPDRTAGGAHEPRAAALGPLPGGRGRGQRGLRPAVRGPAPGTGGLPELVRLVSPGVVRAADDHLRRARDRDPSDRGAPPSRGHAAAPHPLADVADGPAGGRAPGVRPHGRVRARGLGLAR